MAIDWKELKGDFETGGLGYAELARKHRCHAGTVRRRAKNEGWERGEKPFEVLDAHRRLLKGLRRKIGRELKESDVKEPRELKTGVDALLTIFKGERQAWGLEDYGCETGIEETGDITKKMEDSTLPPGAGTSVDGG